MSGHCAILLTGILVLLGGVPAAAQQVRCQTAAPPFATTPGNRMSGAALRAWLEGKRIVAERRAVGRINRYGFAFRADGSVAFSCDSIGGKPCAHFNQSVAASRDIGVWKLDGDVLVLTRTQFVRDGRGEGRVTIHRERGVFAAARAGGPHLCLPGPLIVEQGDR